MRAACSLLVVLAACTRPEPLVLCHNSNCVAPDTTRDDTLDALAESLALTFDGRPALDGIEIDTFWDGARGQCLFAHDLDQQNAQPATAAAQFIADYLAANQVVSWNGERFYFFVEIKGFVGTSISEMHSSAQRAQHTECALDVLDIVATGARAGGHPLTVGFVAARPLLLDTLVTRPRWAGYASDSNLELLAIGDIFAPYSSTVAELDEYTVKLDGIEFHPDYMTVQRRETYRSLGIDLVQWSLITTEEALDSITRWDPRYVLANEALLLRGWTEH
jgi:hypothetical protein